MSNCGFCNNHRKNFDLETDSKGNFVLSKDSDLNDHPDLMTFSRDEIKALANEIQALLIMTEEREIIPINEA